MRKYADNPDGTRRVLLIECDAPGCTATLEPGPHVMTSGWTEHEDRVDDARFRVLTCPVHREHGMPMIREMVSAHRSLPAA